MAIEQVSATAAAIHWIERLVAEHGPVMFFQSGGCCDGSAPMCWPAGEFKIGARDVRLGTIAGAAFYIGGDQYEAWKHTKLEIDVVKGRGAGFSLEAPHGVRFVTRSDLCSVEDQAALAADPLPRGG